MTWPAVGAAAVAGLVLGGLGRNLPLSLALAVLPTEGIDPCGMEEVLSCAFENLPTAFAKMVELALVVVLLCAVLASIGAVALGVGARRLWRASRSGRLVTAETRDGKRPDWLAPGLVGMVSCLLVPAFGSLAPSSYSSLVDAGAGPSYRAVVRSCRLGRPPPGRVSVTPSQEDWTRHGRPPRQRSRPSRRRDLAVGQR